MTWRDLDPDLRTATALDAADDRAVTYSRANATRFGAAIHKPGGWVLIEHADLATLQKSIALNPERAKKVVARVSIPS